MSKRALIVIVNTSAIVLAVGGTALASSKAVGTR